MPLKVRSAEEATNLAVAVRDGVEQEDGTRKLLSPEQKQVALGALRAYQIDVDENNAAMNAQRDPVSGELPDNPKLRVVDNAQVSEDPDGLGSDLWRRTQGVFALGTTMATGTIAEPIAGLNGLITLMRGGSADQAAEAVNGVQQAMTFMGKSETSKDMMNSVMVPLAKIEEAADWTASTLSMGNPYAATAIKTALIGGIEVLGLKGAGRVKIPKALADIQAKAKEMGISLDVNNMQSSILEAAGRMTPTERAANAGFLQTAMRQAAEASKQGVKQAYDTARESRAFVDVKEAKALAGATAKDLADAGFDLQKMPTLMERLTEIGELGTQRTTGNVIQTPSGRVAMNPKTERITAQMRDWEQIRQRVNKDARVADVNEAAALNRLRDNMDDWMDHQLLNDMVDGDPAAIGAWKAAREQYKDYFTDFKEDRMIRNMIEKGSTPEEVRAWMSGMSAIGAKASAGRTMDALKRVLGDDHPAIEGVRQDFLFEVAAPLLRENPSFGGFIANYDKMIANNPSLVRSIGLDQTNLKALRDFAVTAEKLPKNQSILSAAGLTRGLAQFFVGHRIARAALRVNLTRNVANLFFGIDRVSKKSILFDLTNSIHGTPILPRTSAGAAAFITARSVSTAEEAIDRDRLATKRAIDAANEQRGEQANPLL